MIPFIISPACPTCEEAAEARLDNKVRTMLLFASLIHLFRWAIEQSVAAQNDESKDVMKLYPNLHRYYGELSVSKDLYLLTFLSSGDVSRIRDLTGVTQEKDHGVLATAYREILLSHMKNLELARKSVDVCSSVVIEKEIFRIFNECMDSISSQRSVVEKERDKYKKFKLTAHYQIMSVFFFVPVDDYRRSPFYAELFL